MQSQDEKLVEKASLPVTVTPLAFKRLERRIEALTWPSSREKVSSLSDGEVKKISEKKPFRKSHSFSLSFRSAPNYVSKETTGNHEDDILTEISTSKRSLPPTFLKQPLKRLRRSLSGPTQEINNKVEFEPLEKKPNSHPSTKKTKCFSRNLVALFLLGFLTLTANLLVFFLPFSFQDMLFTTVEKVKTHSLVELPVFTTYKKVFASFLPELFSAQLDLSLQDDEDVDLNGLENALIRMIHGQNEAISIIVNCLRMHWTKEEQKPLIFFFEGSSGTGKTMASQIISHYYPNKHVYYFIVPLHFSGIKDEELEEFLFDMAVRICLNRKNCCLIFDNAETKLKPLIALVGQIRKSWCTAGLEHSKLVMILIATTEFPHYEELDNCGREKASVETSCVQKSSGNLKPSSILSDLISSQPYIKHVPFLPLEKQCVEDCIRDELEKHNVKFSNSVLQAVISEVEFVTFGQKTISVSGCKKVPSKVEWIVNVKI